MKGNSNNREAKSKGCGKEGRGGREGSAVFLPKRDEGVVIGHAQTEDELGGGKEGGREGGVGGRSCCTRVGRGREGGGVSSGSSSATTTSLRFLGGGREGGDSSNLLLFLCFLSS